MYTKVNEDKLIEPLDNSAVETGDKSKKNLDMVMKPVWLFDSFADTYVLYLRKKLRVYRFFPICTIQ